MKDNKKIDFEQLGKLQSLEKEIFESSEFRKAAGFTAGDELKSAVKDTLSSRLVKEKRAKVFIRSGWAAAAVIAVVFSAVSLMQPEVSGEKADAPAAVAMAAGSEFWQADSDLTLLETKLENIEYSLAGEDEETYEIESRIESIKQQLSSDQFWKG